MAQCAFCKTENRDKAKFCHGCARPMPALDEADATPTTNGQAKALRETLPQFVRCGACQAMLTPGDSSCPACGAAVPKADKAAEATVIVEGAQPAGQPDRKNWVVVVAGLIALLAVGAWLLLPGSPSSAPPAETSASAATAANPPAASSLPLAQSLAPNEQAEVLVEPLPATPSDAVQKTPLDELVQREAERTERTRQDLKKLAAQEKTAKEARAAQALERRRAEEERQAEDLQASASTPSKEATAKADPTPPPAPTKVSVEQACAGASNFLSRDLCRVAACREAGNARDPICLWYRKLEEERNRRLQGS